MSKNKTTRSMIATELKGAMKESERRLLSEKLLRLRTKLDLRQMQDVESVHKLDVIAHLEGLLKELETYRISEMEMLYQADKKSYERHIGSVTYRAEQKLNKTVGTVKSWFKKNPAPAQAAA